MARRCTPLEEGLGNLRMPPGVLSSSASAVRNRPSLGVSKTFHNSHGTPLMFVPLGDTTKLNSQIPRDVATSNLSWDLSVPPQSCLYLGGNRFIAWFERQPPRSLYPLKPTPIDVLTIRTAEGLPKGQGKSLLWYPTTVREHPFREVN